MSLTHRKIIGAILSFEKNFDIHEYQYRGINIWPLYRFTIFDELLNVQYEPDNIAKDVKNKKAGIFESKVIPYIKKLYHLLRICISIIQERIRLHKYKSIDILFFRREVEADRLIDPLIEIFESDYNCWNLCLHKSDNHRRTIHVNNNIFFRLLQRIKATLYKGKEDSHKINYNIIKDINKHFKGINIRQEETLKMLEEFIGWRHYFIKTMNQLKPKVVFIVCYYGVVQCSLISACKSLNIKTVDIQHGSQNNRFGIGYSEWHPKILVNQDYQLLPDYFLVCGRSFQSELLKWMGGDISNKPIVGGYPWLNKNNVSKYQLNSPYQDVFIDGIKDYENVILTTLQNIKEPIPEPLLEALEQSTEKRWKWLFRFHPLMTEAEKEIVISIITATGADVEWHFSSIMPLKELFPIVNYHITAFSASAEEAFHFGVYNIVVHPIGKDVYEELIAEGYFGYAETGEELLSILEKGGKGFTYNKPYPYIETSRSIASAAIKTILES